MREIKFRAWDKLQKRILYREIFDMNWYGTERNDDKGCHTIRGTQQSDRNILELMQYTGLKDKNGKEIYEGDIVETNSIKWTEPLEVRFLNGAFCVGKKDIGVSDFGDWVTIRDGMAQAQLRDLELELEVIGNIYENKELLK